VKKEMKPILSLTQYLGVATILFGLLSGTFFGVNLIDSGYTLTASSMEQIQSGGDCRPLWWPNCRDPGGERTSRKPGRVFAAAVGIRHRRGGHAATHESGHPEVGRSRPPASWARFRHLMQDSLSMFYLALLIGGVQIIFGIFVQDLQHHPAESGFKYALSTLGWFILLVALVLNATLLGENAGRYVFYVLLGSLGRS
jgi:vacuolar-type H+-ATPase subunit I/STV1